LWFFKALWAGKFPLRVFGADFAGSPRRGERRNDALLLITTTTSRFSDIRMHARSDGRKAGADFSSASSDFKSLGAFFCNFAIWSLSTLAFSQFSVGAHGQPRGRVPDVVASRLLRPYHFRALIQSFQ
jgi:hypothetical protein